MFGKRKRQKDGVESLAIDIDALIACYGSASTLWSSVEDRRSLIRCRYGDICREAELLPPSSQQFQTVCHPMDDESLWRMGVFLAGFAFPPISQQLAANSPRSSTDRETAENALVAIDDLVRSTHLLTFDMIVDSDVRLEELSRHFCDGWGVAIQGESVDESAQRLNQIDFSRLMAEADAARSSADDRMEYLRKLQEEQEELRRPRRGKW